MYIICKYLKNIFYRPIYNFMINTAYDKVCFCLKKWHKLGKIKKIYRADIKGEFEKCVFLWFPYISKSYYEFTLSWCLTVSPCSPSCKYTRFDMYFIYVNEFSIENCVTCNVRLQGPQNNSITLWLIEKVIYGASYLFCIFRYFIQRTIMH